MAKQQKPNETPAPPPALPSRRAVKVGDPVVYRSPGPPVDFAVGEHRAAIVTEVLNAAAGTVRLYVFPPLGRNYRTAAEHDEAGAKGTWHWPERG
jgi:hypothetical protein